jgi:hypothetical protein
MRSALFLAVFAVVAGRGGCDPGATPYEPCADKVCGDACRACPPDARDCAETAVVKACDGFGACVPAPVACAPAPPYDPCANKGCGELCDPCVPGEPCPLYFAAHACDPGGQCVTAGTFTCEPPPPPPPPVDPCAGKRCGDDCVIDPPCAPLCMMPSLLGKCDPLGACQPVTEMKCEPPPPPPIDPCAGKGCGEACSTCTPTAGTACPAVMMYCDAVGQCGYAYPICTATPL